MPTLPTDLRNRLAKTVQDARDAAERAALSALIAVGVPLEPRDDDSDLLKSLRSERERLEGFGDLTKTDPLVHEVAYQHWHRMLFARFLAENGLLIHPEHNVPVTLEECAELAGEEGDADAWAAAARYASHILPGIFRQDDPTLKLRLAPEGMQALEKLVEGMPTAVFKADDSLGWVYQFWQARCKEEVNKSGKKIQGADIFPVTQLFTEPYMVRFLLENSLGAWWVSRHPNEPIPWQNWLAEEGSYLRRNEDGSPAAGTFPGWPDTAKELRVLDPCCGSGHFLVDAFEMLRRIRMAEEGLSEADAGDAVLQDNLFGLEIDPRCVQIAAFQVAFAAWKSGGHRKLPLPHIACSGLRIKADAEQWRRLANGNGSLAATLAAFHQGFQQAPVIGSLLNLHSLAGRIGVSDRLEDIIPDLERVLDRKEEARDPVADVWGEAAKGAARAMAVLLRHYHLIATNVPYLSAQKQEEDLRGYIERNHTMAKADLATAFVERCLDFCKSGGSTALVTPQNWLFLGTYKKLRVQLLQWKSWDFVARLGPKAFQTPMWDFNIALLILTDTRPAGDHEMAGMDASGPRTATEKAKLLRCGDISTVKQADQVKNPDARITIDSIAHLGLLSDLADSFKGISTGDDGRFRRNLTEFPSLPSGWAYLQSTVSSTTIYAGCSAVLWLEAMTQPETEGVYIRGQATWHKLGIMISQIGQLPCALSVGTPFDTNAGVILPTDPAHLPAVWAFCSSHEYSTAVRKIDQKLWVTNATLAKVPFDLERWQKVADEKYPNGLPEPDSDDPTQWLFHGRIPDSTAPLHVAMARLLGFQWPRQQGQTVSGAGPVAPDGLEDLSDGDGIVCLPPVCGEQPAAERLRALLARAYGADWSVAVQDRLLAQADGAGKTLDEWLRNSFFAQHCKLFHNRPFLWHIWDGRKDGFSAIVNYHTFDRAKLDRLIYTHLGDWISRRREDERQGLPGANALLVAAIELQRKLELIREGEPPYDIFVRWKPLAEQPIGWEPDLNDGVRLNIRPFVTAGILRSKFTINWNKDRGTDPTPNAGGTTERLNDKHLTRGEKEAARRGE